MTKSKKILTGLLVIPAILLMTGCSLLTSSPNTTNNAQDNTSSRNTETSTKKVSQDIEVSIDEYGLEYEDYRIDVDNHEYEGGPIEKGSELTLTTYGVNGYEEYDGLVYPYVEQWVTDSQGEVIYEEEDLIPEDVDGIDADTASETYTYLDINRNYDSGGSYQWVTRYSDREGDNTMDVVVGFMVE